MDAEICAFECQQLILCDLRIKKRFKTHFVIFKDLVHKVSKSNKLQQLITRFSYFINF